MSYDYLYLLAKSIQNDTNFVTYANKPIDNKSTNGEIPNIYYSTCDSNCYNMCDQYNNLFCSKSVDVKNISIYMMYISTGNTITDSSSNTLTGPYLYSNTNEFKFNEVDKNIFSSRNYLLNLAS